LGGLGKRTIVVGVQIFKDRVPKDMPARYDGLSL